MDYIGGCQLVARANDNTDIPTSEGIGIDLGLRFVICSDGNTYKNINTKQTK